MSNFAQVRKALQENPGITIVDAPERWPNDVQAAFTQVTDFHVAPKRGGLYTARELQALMASLLPDLEPTSVVEFQECGSDMVFGSLYFFESEALKGMPLPAGFPADGSEALERTDRLYRHTRVRVFPNTRIAKGALKGENQYRIPKKEFAKYHGRGVIARLIEAVS